MDISRETTEANGVFTTTTVAVYTQEEARALKALAAFFRDLAGHSSVAGQDIYDNSAVLILTQQRRASLVDGADLLEKIITG